MQCTYACLFFCFFRQTGFVASSLITLRVDTGSLPITGYTVCVCVGECETEGERERERGECFSTTGSVFGCVNLIKV